MVPLDGTELAEGILPYVSQLSKGLGMELVLLAVVDPDAVEIPDRLAPVDSSGTIGRLESIGFPQMVVESESTTSTLVRETGQPHATQLFDRAESSARSRLSEVAKRLAADGVQAEAEVAIGNPAEQIVDTARRYDCDLIAMSTHGRNALGRGILGSVTDKVIHCPSSRRTPPHISGRSLDASRNKAWKLNGRCSRVHRQER